MSYDKDKQAKIGAQRPRIEHAPLYVTSLGHDAVDLAKICNIFLDDWQVYVLEKSMGLNADNSWVCNNVGLIVPRQNGKNVILEARELAGCFLLGETNIAHTAHEYKTASKSQYELIRKLRTSPELMEYVQGFDGDVDAERIQGFKTGHGAESIVFDFGNERGTTSLNRFSTISYSTRTKHGGRGLTGDVVIFDEAFALTEAQLGAIYSQQSARSMEGRNQTWFVSSAGERASETLRKVRQAGIEKLDNELGFFEWSVPEDANLDDFENWRIANPAMNIRISDKQIGRERQYMSDEQFGRERLGIWNDTEEEIIVIDSTNWQECATSEKSILNNKVFFSLDIPPSRDVTTIVACCGVEDNKILVEIVARDYGTAWVGEKLAQLQKNHAGSVTIIDPASAVGSLRNELRKYRIRVKEITVREYAKACGLFFDYVNMRKILHTNQDVLNSAVGNAKMRPYGESLWKWARAKSEIDISPLIASTQAFHYCHEFVVLQNKKNKEKQKLAILEK